MNYKRQHGFSLIELLIVVAIIGIIAAIAVPNLLASKRAANEGSAEASLRAIHSSQITYANTTGSGAYAPDLATLRAQRLIDEVLGTGVKSGYRFEIVDQAGTGSSAVFGCYGYPVTTSGVATTGTRAMGITEAGILRGETDTTNVPNTRGDINALPPLGN